MFQLTIPGVEVLDKSADISTIVKVRKAKCRCQARPRLSSGPTEVEHDRRPADMTTMGQFFNSPSIPPSTPAAANSGVGREGGPVSREIGAAPRTPGGDLPGSGLTWTTLANSGRWPR